MPKKAPTTKKPSNKKPAPAPEAPKTEPPKKEAPPKKASVTEDAPLALRLAVLEDVVRRANQETRAFGTKLETFAASQAELARRVADVEKRAS